VELDQLRTFLAILEHGSFSRAADVLHLAPSTVSFQIRALETATGSRVLDRMGRRVRPTASGRYLQRYARRILALRDEALAGLHAREHGDAGQLTVAASTLPAEFLLPPALAAVRGRYPGVSIVVEVSDSRRATAALLSEGCDLAIVGERVRDRRVVSSPIADDEIVLVGPPAAAPGRAATAGAQRRLALVLREHGSGTGGHVAALVARLAAERGGALTITQVGSTSVARRCALEGLGLTFISRRAVEDDLRAGRLVELPLRGTPVRRQVHAARLRAAAPSPVARALLAELARLRRR
jgi:DNA-binding transcriptional LysR family regulator